jgi:hypothetical protein
MAGFFPIRSQCQFDTPGERRFPSATYRNPNRVAAVQAGKNGLTTSPASATNRPTAGVLSEMAILFRSESQARAAEHALTQAGIPYASGLASKNRSDLYGSDDSVTIVNMHSNTKLR